MSRVRNCKRAVAAAAAILALAGCSTSERVLSSIGLGSSSSQPSDLVGTPPKQANANPASNIDASSNCPVTDVRQGASTYTIRAKGTESAALALRYQATISRLARECAVLGATMTIKVGVQGRIVLGPAGGPGEIVVPIRYALVQEGIQPKTIATKFYRVPVSIPAGHGNVPFTHIEEDLTFPTPPVADLQNYVVYVGFDPKMMEQKPARARKSVRRR